MKRCRCHEGQRNKDWGCQSPGHTRSIVWYNLDKVVSPLDRIYIRQIMVLCTHVSEERGDGECVQDLTLLSDTLGYIRIKRELGGNIWKGVSDDQLLKLSGRDSPMSLLKYNVHKPTVKKVRGGSNRGHEEIELFWNLWVCVCLFKE